MDAKKINKNLKAYSRYYRNVIENEGIDNIGGRMASYEARLRTMYESDAFEKHDVYPSTNVSFVYAVIAMCQEIQTFGFLRTYKLLSYPNLFEQTSYLRDSEP